MRIDLSAILQVIRPKGPLRCYRWGVTTFVVAVLAILIGLRPSQNKAAVNANNHIAPLPSVAVAKVVREDLFQQVTVPAEFRAYAEVELHAKVSGYVDQMNVDFGDQVKAGQLLATLEVPELQDELHNAIATEQKAEADYTNAHLICSRLLSVDHEHPRLVAQQDLDTAQSKVSTTAAAIAEARAEVEKFQTLAHYTRITAPFDGVVTHRYVDPGALIQAGTASQTQSLPLVRVSDNYRLRLDFPVSVDYVQRIQSGDPVDVRVGSLGDRTFTGIISRCTHQVDEQTRTMLVEMEVPNSKLEIVPGMYATVSLKVEKRPQALAIPVEAISAGHRSTIRVVNAHHEVEERTVTLGLETPTRYEIVSGLKEGELVVIGNADQVKPGQKVETKLLSPLAAQ
jgi:RND family efflux transporter MFP subunit